jgi:hypothetical protein
LDSKFPNEIYSLAMKFIELAGWKPGPDMKDGEKSCK